MAMNTQSKRMSALLEGLVLPSGVITAAERAATAWQYNGNAFPSALALVVGGDVAIEVGEQFELGGGGAFISFG